MTPDSPNPFGIEEREYVPFCPVPSCDTEFMFASPDEARDHMAREHDIPRHAVVFPSDREQERLMNEPTSVVDNIVRALRDMRRGNRDSDEDKR